MFAAMRRASSLVGLASVDPDHFGGAVPAVTRDLLMDGGAKADVDAVGLSARVGSCVESA